jgi:hypothetical protein
MTRPPAIKSRWRRLSASIENGFVLDMPAR